MIKNVKCQKCGAVYNNVPDGLYGKKVQCKKCKNIFLIKGIDDSAEGIQKEALNDNGRKPAEIIVKENNQLQKTEWEIGNTILGTYDIIGVLGEGGFGIVHKVKHKNWNIDLAVKSLKSDAAKMLTGMENFKREAETWVNLGLHPNIVSCYYIREAIGVPRIFIEYISGGSLKDWIIGGKTEDYETILDIAIQMAWGLNYAHEKGLVHQDFKPANVMITEDGIAKITDFGLANALKGLGGEEKYKNQDNIMVSSGGYTPAYAAPEQVKSGKVSKKTDMWGFGLSILEMFTGEVTWQIGVVASEVLESYIQDEGRQEKDLEIPDSLVVLLRECFKFDPLCRPANMNQIAEKLSDIFKETTGKESQRKQPIEGMYSADSLNNRAVSLIDLNKSNESENIWIEALKIQPHHPESTYNYGLLKWKLGEITDEELVRQLEEVRQSHETKWVDEYLLALFHSIRGDHKAASGILTMVNSYDQQQNEIIELKERCKSVENDTELKLIKIDADVFSYKIQPHSLTRFSYCKNTRYGLLGTTDFTLSLIDLNTRKVVRKFSEGHHDMVTTVAISTDNKLAASGSADNDIRVWDIAAGECVSVFSGHKKGKSFMNNGIKSLLFDKDSSFLYSGGGDRYIKKWDLKKHNCVLSFSGGLYAENELTFNYNRNQILSTSIKDLIKVWDLKSGEKLYEVKTGNDNLDSISSIISSSVNNNVFIGKTKGLIELWDIEKKKCIRKYIGNKIKIKHLHISTDQKYLLSSACDGSVRIWDISTGSCLKTLALDKLYTPYARIELLENGWYNITGVLEKRSESPSLFSNKWKPANIPYHISKITLSTELADNTKKFQNYIGIAKQARIENDLTKELIKLKKARSLPGFERDPAVIRYWQDLYLKLAKKGLNNVWQHSVFSKHSAVVNSIFLSKDGSLCFSKDWTGKSIIWEVLTGNIISQFDERSSTDTMILMSHDNKLLISCLFNGDIIIREIETLEVKKQLKGHSGQILSMCLSIDDRFLLSGGFNDKTMRLWDMSSGVCLRVFVGMTSLIQFVFMDRDNQHCYAVAGSIYVFKVENGECLRKINGYGDLRTTVIHPDQVSILVGGKNNLKRIEINSNKMLKKFDSSGDIYRLEITRDGKYAFSGERDKTIKVWDLNSGKCLREIHAHENHLTSLSLSADGRILVSGSYDKTCSVWTLDWDLEETYITVESKKRLRFLLSRYIDEHIPRMAVLPDGREPTEIEMKNFLQRNGKPGWQKADLFRLLYDLACEGFGYIKPDEIEAMLIGMVKDRYGQDFENSLFFSVKIHMETMEHILDRLEQKSLSRKPVEPQMNEDEPNNIPEKILKPDDVKKEEIKIEKKKNNLKLYPVVLNKVKKPVENKKKILETKLKKPKTISKKELLETKLNEPVEDHKDELLETRLNEPVIEKKEKNVLLETKLNTPGADKNQLLETRLTSHRKTEINQNQPKVSNKSNPLLENKGVVQKKKNDLKIKEKKSGRKVNGYLSDMQGNRFTGSGPIGNFKAITHDCPFCNKNASMGRTLIWIISECVSKGRVSFPCNTCKKTIQISKSIFPEIIIKKFSVPFININAELEKMAESELLNPNWRYIIADENIK